MNPKPKNVKPLENYKLKVEFENGEEKIFDMKPYLTYPVYKDLNDENVFKEAQIKYRTVIWNEEIDVDPDRLF